ncbi:MAG: zinc-ribbon domain-containing protein [Eubacteriales bacterium]
MYCRNCGKPMDPAASFCVTCGMKVGQRHPNGRLVSNFCKNCGKPIDPAADVCLSCGVAVQEGSFSRSMNTFWQDVQQSVFRHFIDMLRNIFDYEGRTGVAPFWWAILFGWLFSLLFAWSWVIPAIIALAFISLQVRRLHDVGRSGWFLLFWLLPLVGWLVLLILYCQPSQP